MKYLRIHTMLWAIICFISVLLNAISYIIYAFFIFIWSLKFEKWSDYNRCESRWNNQWDGTVYIDRTPLDTFRRYFYMFD